MIIMLFLEKYIIIFYKKITNALTESHSERRTNKCFNIQLCFSFWQLGPNIKELFRLVEDFVDVISLRMKDFQDTYEVTDNLGQFTPLQ